MNTIPENIPAEIFEFISHSDYNALTLSQQELVHLYLSVDLYNELRDAHLLLSEHDIHSTSEATFLPELLNHFDNIHHKSKPKFSIHWPSISAVTAAACILAAVIIFRKQQPTNPSIQLAYHDTTYLDNPDTIRIFDTVYQQVVTESKQRQHEKQIITKELEVLPELPEINTPSLDAVRRNRSQPIKDDTLISQFGFAKL